MPRKKRTAPVPGGDVAPAFGALFASDLREADELATATIGEVRPEYRLPVALWLAVERLRRTVQATAPAPWEFSKGATYDKARALGVQVQEGECWQALAQRLKQVAG